ncbi:MAG: S8 family serine peptidase, partial [Syntrophomonadaceae bacterium]
MKTKPRKVVVLFVMLALLVTMSLPSIPKLIAAEEINDLSNETVETVLQETPAKTEAEDAAQQQEQNAGTDLEVNTNQELPAEIQPEEAKQNSPDSESDSKPLPDTTPIVSETEEEPGDSPTIPSINEEEPFQETEPVHIFENADLKLFNQPLPPEGLEPVEPVKPVITYGPYQGINHDQKHAYEPFREENVNTEAREGNRFKKDQLLIKMASDNTTNRFQASSYSVPFSTQGVISLEPLFPTTSNTRKLSVQSTTPQTGTSTGTWYKARLQAGTDVLAAAEAIAQQSGVIAAEPDYIRATFGEPDGGKMNEQWYLKRCGIPDAWKNLEDLGIDPGGSRDVIVAVIDTGVDYNHPDLASNMWTNTGEIPGDGIDNDGNGFIDDIHGACTVGNRYSGESGDPMDDHGHGTHVAGIIAASGGVDRSGMTGIAYNVQIMAIKAAQSSGVLTASDIAQAIYYAVDKGADVINMSFGGYGRSTVEEDALQLAFGQAVLVAAAGNDSKPNLPHPLGKDLYPAAYPWVLGVMA